MVQLISRIADLIGVWAGGSRVQTASRACAFTVMLVSRGEHSSSTIGLGALARASACGFMLMIVQAAPMHRGGDADGGGDSSASPPALTRYE